MIFHYQVWIERGFLSFLANSLIIAAGTLLLGTLAGFWIAIKDVRREALLQVRLP